MAKETKKSSMFYVLETEYNKLLEDIETILSSTYGDPLKLVALQNVIKQAKLFENTKNPYSDNAITDLFFNKIGKKEKIDFHGITFFPSIFSVI